MSAVGENAGPIVSTTWTVHVAIERLPNGSDAVQVTGVAPIGNVVFGRGEQMTLVPAFPVSSAVGVLKNTLAPARLVAWTQMSFTTVLLNVGDALSEGSSNDARNESTTVGSIGSGVTRSTPSASIDPP